MRQFQNITTVAVPDGHLAYQTFFRCQLAYFERNKMGKKLINKSKHILKILAPTVAAYGSLSLSARRHPNEISFDMPNDRCCFQRSELELSNI